jgi:hypothetical protein
MLSALPPITSHVANDDSRSDGALILLRVLLGCTLLASIFLSSPMWLSTREFPLVPLSTAIPQFSSPLDLAFIILLVAGIVVTIIRPSSVAAFGIVGSLLFLWAQDQNRIHPWVFVYILFYATLAVQWRAQAKTTSAYNVTPRLQFILIAVYFWTGVQKLRYTYFVDVVEVLVGFLKPGSSESTLLAATLLFRSAPFLEILFALLLIHPRLARLGVVGVLALHLGITLLLASNHFNASVLPWNLFMTGAVLLLFWRKTPSSRLILRPGRSLFRWLVLLLCGILPTLGYVGLWNSYLSFAVYAGASARGYGFIRGSTDFLPDTMRFQLNEIDEDAKELQFDEWGYSVLNSMPSPEAHVLLGVGRALCKEKFTSKEGLTLAIIDAPLPWERRGRETTYTCTHGELAG